MIKVLHIIPSMNPVTGGVCQAVKTMIKYTTDSDHTHDVVSLDKGEESFVLNEKFVVHGLGIGISPWHFNAKLLPWLIVNLRKYNCIIIHGLWQYQSLAVVIALKVLGLKETKVFVMPHGMLDPYFQKAKGRKIKSLRNSLFWTLVEKHLINNADCLLYTCETERDLAQKTFRNFKPKAQQTIGLGVEEPPQFTSELSVSFYSKFPQLVDQPFILFLSRIHQKKGLDLLIDAYKRLKMKHFDAPAIVIAGPGLESVFGREMIQRAGNDQNIIFAGMLSGNEKWGAFHECESFILPSHQENFGISIVEAMACAKPVLISRKINIYKEIEDNDAGLVSDDLEDGVFEMLNKWVEFSASEAATYGENSRSTYLKFFSPLVAAKAFLNTIGLFL